MPGAVFFALQAPNTTASWAALLQGLVDLPSVLAVEPNLVQQVYATSQQEKPPGHQQQQLGSSSGTTTD